MTEFIMGLVGLLFVWGAFSLRNVSIKQYFSTREGRGILKGIVIAVTFLVVGAGITTLLSGCSGTYLNDASIYGGLDYPRDPSPQCRQAGADDRSTSNLGLKLNLYQSETGLFRTNAKYTHHSCAFSPDRNTYDAVGIEVEYILWDSRK